MIDHTSLVNGLNGLSRSGKTEFTRYQVRRSVAGASVLHAMGSTRVVRICHDVVVKYGPNMWICEAQNMNVVHKHNVAKPDSAIRIPELLDAWVDDTTDADNEAEYSRSHEEPFTYIVMAYVEGELLANAWQSMNEDQRAGVVGDVAKMLQELRTIELRKSGPAGEREKCCGYFFTEYEAGPFHTAKDLEGYFNNRLQLCKAFKKVQEDRPAFEIEKLVMSHMDPHPNNIIIDRVGHA